MTTGDEEMLRRALDNLLANVGTHTPEGTTATITAASHDGEVRIEVSDDGPGVPASELPRIFDRFYRAGAPPQRRGSGLGLAIVAAIAAAHHGTVQAALNQPRGLRVTLALPSRGACPRSCWAGILPFMTTASVSRPPSQAGRPPGSAATLITVAPTGAELDKARRCPRSRSPWTSWSPPRSTARPPGPP